MTYDNWLFYLEIDFYLTLKGSGPSTSAISEH